MKKFISLMVLMVFAIVANAQQVVSKDLHLEGNLGALSFAGNKGNFNSDAIKPKFRADYFYGGNAGNTFAIYIDSADPNHGLKKEQVCLYVSGTDVQLLTQPGMNVYVATLGGNTMPISIINSDGQWVIVVDKSNRLESGIYYGMSLDEIKKQLAGVPGELKLDGTVGTKSTYKFYSYGMKDNWDGSVTAGKNTVYATFVLDSGKLVRWVRK